MDTNLGEPIASGRTAEIYAWDEGRVLKLFRPGFEEGAQHEFNVAQAVTANGVPAPKAFNLIRKQDRPGIVYQRVDGVSMLRELSSRPWRFGALARLMAELHAKIHDRTTAGLPSQRERLLRWLGEAPITEAQKHAIAIRLGQLPDGVRLCHGDFHPDNILLTSSASGSGAMIIDWTNASAGNTFGDVAWTSFVLRLGDPPAGPLRPVIQILQRRFHDAYVERYSQLNRDTRNQLDLWRLPMAVARLRDCIPHEREALLSTIADLAQPKTV